MARERELIRFIAAGRAGASVRRGDVGIGDDCAVIRCGRRSLLVTIDLMTEGIHFDLRRVPPRVLGRKAVAAALSDIAAMGGNPLALFVSLALPGRRTGRFAGELLDGIHAEALAARTPVLGGDTSSSAGGVHLDVAALGEAERRGPVMRSGARPGDRIYVSGTLGGSAAGLALLRTGRFGIRKVTALVDRAAGAERRARSRRFRDPTVSALLAHLFPRPRLALGKALARGRIATAMIDVSDGLATDLHALCEASGVGAALEAPRIPIHPALVGAPRAGSRLAAAPLDAALSGGEDYELLFAVSKRSEPRLRSVAASCAVPLTLIGRITPRGGGLRLLDARGRSRPLPRLGYEHLRR